MLAFTGLRQEQRAMQAAALKFGPRITKKSSRTLLDTAQTVYAPMRVSRPVRASQARSRVSYSWS
jgi:hypothetical protein